jgi:hypothetical protein
MLAAAAGCQLVLPDGGGGSGTTGTSKSASSSSSSTGTGTDTCATVCTPTSVAKCDTVFKNRCTEICAVVGVMDTSCAITNAQNGACSGALTGSSCQTEFCGVFDTVCQGANAQCAQGPCAGLWLALAQKYKNQGCNQGWRDACGSLDKSCSEANNFNPGGC